MHDSFLPSQVSSWWLSYVLRAHCNENVETDIEKRGREREGERKHRYIGKFKREKWEKEICFCLYFLKRSKRFQYRNVFYLLLKEIIRCFNAYGAGIEVTIDNICWQENKWICHIMVEMSLDICVLTYLKQHSKHNSNPFKLTL